MTDDVRAVDGGEGEGAELYEARRRREAALAGHNGDESLARRFLEDPSPRVRAAALGALVRLDRADRADMARLVRDPEPVARRRACELAAAMPGVDLRPLLADTDPSVVEAAAWAIGERGPAGLDAVAALATLARDHPDALCREAAVAGLGSIGHQAGLPAILAATTDKPAVRRRAVIALAPFEGPEVEAALRRALEDRDWQVRQVAEDLLAQDGPRQ